jgi:hypothetical protein
MDVMMHQNKRIQGKSVALLYGLARQVQAVIERLEHIELVTSGQVRRYRGLRKVKIVEPWPPGCLELLVCDGDFGERRMVVHTKKRAAIARILEQKLKEEGIYVA